MFWKKKSNPCEHIQDKSETIANETTEETTECKPKPNRKIINGKLYDTSKAERICDLILGHEDIPNYDLPIRSLGGQDVIIYRGISKWFIEYFRLIEPVEEDWVKYILGKYDIDKYIELFGEVEEA